MAKQTPKQKAAAKVKRDAAKAAKAAAQNPAGTDAKAPVVEGNETKSQQADGPMSVDGANPQDTAKLQAAADAPPAEQTVADAPPPEEPKAKKGSGPAKFVGKGFVICSIVENDKKVRIQLPFALNNGVVLISNMARAILIEEAGIKRVS